jgi:hypothetical protein
MRLMSEAGIWIQGMMGTLELDQFCFLAEEDEEEEPAIASSPTMQFVDGELGSK